MNLLEVQNTVAADLGYHSWEALVHTKMMDETEADAITYMEIVAKKFAAAKLEEAARLPGIPKNQAIDILKIKLH